jgi:Uncharacterised nucleotidyltransferase
MISGGRRFSESEDARFEALAHPSELLYAESMTSRASLAQADKEAAARTLGAMLAGPSPLETSLSFSDDDWDRIVRRAIDERLGALLFWTLRHDPRVLDRFRSRLRSELYRAEAFSLTLYRELAMLLGEGAARGLTPPILLKGGALAATLYEQLGLRPMSDLDLLVGRAELDAWLEAARDIGFRRLCPEMARGLTEKVHYQVALAGGVHGETILELHFGLVAGASDWRSPDAAWFLDRSEALELPPEVSGPPARQLLPGPHLLYLSAHAMLQHGGAQARLIWFHDIHLLVSRLGERIDWSSLLERAGSLRWDAALRGALSRARDLFGTSIPEAAMEALDAAAARDSTASGRVGRLSDPTMSRAELVWSELRSVAARDRLRWALAILLPRPEYMRWRYPAAGSLWPALYPYRWARVFWEGAGALARAAFGPHSRRLPSC